MVCNAAGADVVVSAVKHGGDLASAIDKYQIPREQWQDLSTGISPWVWPVPAVPDAIWNRLPEIQPLLAAAQAYYQTDAPYLLAVAGTQVAIRHIPFGVKPATVAIPALGYQEHRHSWLLAGHQVVNYNSFEELESLVAKQSVQHVVVINPNNPTGQRINKNKLLGLRGNMQPEQLLVIDEAFADVDNSDSLAAECMTEGLVVLRSLGKFFGLAGVRLGFAMGNHKVLSHLQALTQPWGVSAPAAFIGELALLDKPWQVAQRARIQQQSAELTAVLQQRFADQRIVNAGLFVSVFGSQELFVDVYEQAAKAGILLRYDQYDEGAWLRFGLAADNFSRLKQHWCM